MAIVKVLNRLHNQLFQMLYSQIIILTLVRSLTAVVYILVEGRIQILLLLLLRYLLHDHWLMSNQRLLNAQGLKLAGLPQLE